MREFINVWLNALRSGGYKQNKGYEVMRNTKNQYSALGVFCDVVCGHEGWFKNTDKDTFYYYGFNEGRKLHTPSRLPFSVSRNFLIACSGDFTFEFRKNNYYSFPEYLKRNYFGRFSWCVCLLNYEYDFLEIADIVEMAELQNGWREL
jgi:hypothetical protein